MTNTRSTDIAIIGAGTAGLSAAREITLAGASALLIDRGPLGTTCARAGCMPSKAALHAGRQWATLRELGGGGPTHDGLKPDDLWRHVQATRDRLAQGAARRTIDFAGDQLVMGEARFLDERTIDVDGQRISARAFVVATGSRPVVPVSLASLGDGVLTTDTLFDLPSLPRSIGILGMGAIGLEMGLALARLGVRVVGGDLKAAPAGIADPEVLDRAIERFGRELTMWLGHKVDAHKADGQLLLSSAGSTATVDCLLAALGRSPNVDALELWRAGIAPDGGNRLPLDADTLRLGQAPIFLAGDVSPDRPLMHEALDEGRIAADGALRMIGLRPKTPPPRRTPIAIVFSDPDVAAVGVAFDALDPDRTVIGTAQGSDNGRSRILGDDANLVRVYADRRSGALLGASLIATHGEHLAHLLAWAVQRGETVHDLLGMPFYHPTIEEMVQTALKHAAKQCDRA